MKIKNVSQLNEITSSPDDDYYEELGYYKTLGHFL